MRLSIRQGERRQTLEDAAVCRLALWHREFEPGVQMQQQQTQANHREEGVAGVGRVPVGVVQQLRGIAHGALREDGHGGVPGREVEGGGTGPRWHFHQ